MKKIPFYIPLEQIEIAGKFCWTYFKYSDYGATWRKTVKQIWYELLAGSSAITALNSFVVYLFECILFVTFIDDSASSFKFYTDCYELILIWRMNLDGKEPDRPNLNNLNNRRKSLTFK